MKLYVKDENSNLVSLPRIEIPNLKTGEIFIESNSNHEGEHISYIEKSLKEQKRNYMDMVFDAQEIQNKKSLFYYIENVKVFTNFNGKLLYI